MEKKEKTVWIDMDNRILAFQPFENGNRISLGMLISLAIGTCIKKEGQNDDEKE